jgi:hypothetical protein
LITELKNIIDAQKAEIQTLNFTIAKQKDEIQWKDYVIEIGRDALSGKLLQAKYLSTEKELAFLAEKKANNELVIKKLCLKKVSDRTYVHGRTGLVFRFFEIGLTKELVCIGGILSFREDISNIKSLYEGGIRKKRLEKLAVQKGMAILNLEDVVDELDIEDYEDMERRGLLPERG